MRKNSTAAANAAAAMDRPAAPAPAIDLQALAAALQEYQTSKTSKTTSKRRAPRQQRTIKLVLRISAARCIAEARGQRSAEVLAAFVGGRAESLEQARFRHADITELVELARVAVTS